MELAKPAYTLTIETHPTKPIEEQAVLCGQYALVNSLQNLLTYPWIYEKSQKNELFLHAWYFDLLTGVIHAYDPKQACFYKI